MSVLKMRKYPLFSLHSPRFVCHLLDPSNHLLFKNCPNTFDIYGHGWLISAMCVWLRVQLFRGVSVSLIWKVYRLLLGWVMLGEHWHFHPSGPLPTHASFLTSSGTLSSLVAIQCSTFTDKTLHISRMTFRIFYASETLHGFTPDPFCRVA